MAEYIEREALMVALCKEIIGDGDYYNGKDDMQGQIRDMVSRFPAADVAPVRHARWEDGRCSNCKEEAVSTSFYEPIYDYDWEENLRYSHTETHTEYHLTNYCPNCGCKMDLEG